MFKGLLRGVISFGMAGIVLYLLWMMPAFQDPVELNIETHWMRVNLKPTFPIYVIMSILAYFFTRPNK